MYSKQVSTESAAHRETIQRMNERGKRATHSYTKWAPIGTYSIRCQHVLCLLFFVFNVHLKGVTLMNVLQEERLLLRRDGWRYALSAWGNRRRTALSHEFKLLGWTGLHKDAHVKTGLCDTVHAPKQKGKERPRWRKIEILYISNGKLVSYSLYVGDDYSGTFPWWRPT